MTIKLKHVFPQIQQALIIHLSRGNSGQLCCTEREKERERCLHHTDLGETVSVTNWSYTGTSLFLPGQSQYTNKQWSSSYPHAAHGPSALTSLNLLLP